MSDSLAKELLVARTYIQRDSSAGRVSQVRFDPRFLVFEFMAGIVLRPRQVELVNSLTASAQANTSCVQQMIMGQVRTLQ